MKKAYMTVTNELLEALLKLPETVRVEAVTANGKNGLPNSFVVCLEGDGLPDFAKLKDGEAAQPVTIIYEKFTDVDNLVPNVRQYIKEIKKA